jgi:hypothetical protein
MLGVLTGSILAAAFSWTFPLRVLFSLLFKMSLPFSLLRPGLGGF